MNDRHSDGTDLVNTGVEGLDDILHGGLAPNRLYLVQGAPGAGKTTLALQFLLQGAAKGERSMFVTLSESEEEIRATAVAHGWSLRGIDLLPLTTPEEGLEQDSRMFHPSEVELTETTRRVLVDVEAARPARLVFDSLSELRLLAQTPLRYRRQILALKQFFSRRQCTVLLTDDQTNNSTADIDLQSICHGVISLERRLPEYGVLRRRLQVSKMRARVFREGYHDFRINRGGLEIYPRLVASEHPSASHGEAVPSGVKALDDLLGGGLTRGTSNLIMGPAGAGKSTLAAQYAIHAARQGQHAAIYLFDESISTFRERLASLAMDPDPLMKADRLSVRQVDPAELSPGELAHGIRRSVEQYGSRIVVIDSLNGYLNAMPSEQFLTLHLHELFAYLGQQGVTTLTLLAQHGFWGAAIQSPFDASYLADTVLLLRYFEAYGEVRKAISVIKKRAGGHEHTIRELTFDQGIRIGRPIKEFHGVLSGAPVLARAPSRQEMEGT